MVYGNGAFADLPIIFFVAMPFYQENHGEAIDAANSWVARFAPLVMTTATLDEAAIKRSLGTIDSLRSECNELNPLVDRLGPEHADLQSTYRQAAAQLDSLETDFRKRLARVAPGDPDGQADLQTLQERLEERSARQEVGLPTSEEIPAVLDLKTGPGNIAGGLFMGVFGFGWTSFTLFHAIFMIGGMAKTFGWWALGLLGFYSIFFLVGFGMLAGAFATMASEQIKLDGLNLTVTKRFGPFSTSKKYTLMQGYDASVGESSVSFRRENSLPTLAIQLVRDDGKSISIASTALPIIRQQLCDQINAYLKAQR